MRFLGLAVVTSAALVLGACGGDKTPKTDSAVVVAPPPTTTSAVVAAPITGQTIVVKMIGDGATYKFDPAEVTLKQGDGIKFIMVSAGPHNVAFDPTTLPEAAKAQLMANMTEQSTELSGKILTQPNEEYVLSFAGVPAGTYDFHCTPHLAMNMRGKVTVQ